MKTSLLFLIFTAFAIPAFGAETDRVSNTIVLNENAAQNLRIASVEVEETDFAETAFSLGRIEAIPQKVGAVSSRISGRMLELKAILGEPIQEGQEVAKVESRQAGAPPPSVVLKAPLAGLVTKLDTRLGDPVEPDKALLEITDLSEVHAVARVPEHLAGRMKPGMKAQILVAALPEGKFAGEMLRFGTSTDRESGTIDVIFRLPNPAGLLRPGMRAEFSIVLSQRSGVMSVPRSALQGDAANRFVFVEDFDLKNAFLKTPVVVGQMNDRFIEIVSGLLPGDKVVSQGAYSLAFAGGGGVSLKEALDAAHGHEHAADGSELKAEDQKNVEHKQGNTAPTSPLWKIVSGVLGVLLVISLLFRRKEAKL